MTTRRRTPRDPTKPLPKRPVLPKGKAAGEPESTGEQLRRLVTEKDWHRALKLAAKLPATPEPDKTTFQRAWEALARPEFSRQLGRDPEALIEAGKEALRRRFGGP